MKNYKVCRILCLFKRLLFTAAQKICHKITQLMKFSLAMLKEVHNYVTDYISAAGGILDSIL